MSTTKSFSRSSTATSIALLRRTAAAAANDSGRLSTLWMCSAVRKAPICAGNRMSGVKICSSASLRSSGVKYSGVCTSLTRSGLKELAVYSDMAMARGKGGGWLNGKEVAIADHSTRRTFTSYDTTRPSRTWSIMITPSKSCSILRLLSTLIHGGAALPVHKLKKLMGSAADCRVR